MTDARRSRAHLWGVLAEYLSIALLLAKGYTILERRHRNRGGEIDVVATRGDILAFIEVKARAGTSDALDSVTRDKRRRLARAAESYIACHRHHAQRSLRFDVMVITSPLRIHHLKDAWRPE